LSITQLENLDISKMGLGTWPIGGGPAYA